MATKKRVVDQCPQEIVIMATGPNQQVTYLDAAGGKHHAKVFWQALDPTKKYQIVLTHPPKPFANGNAPFPTDATGRTITLTVDGKLSSGATMYGYTVEEL